MAIANVLDRVKTPALTVAKAGSFQVPVIVAEVGPTVFRVLYRSNPQQEHPNCVPSCDWPVLGLVSAGGLSKLGRHRAHHGGGLHRAAPGLAANRQAAYGRDPDAVFLADRKRDSGDEPGPGGQDSEVFAHRRQNAGAASPRGAKALRLYRCNSPGRPT